MPMDVTSFDTHSPGRVFFDEHMRYIYANDTDGMIDDQYHEDAVLISPFAVDGSAPHVVRGRSSLKQFFREYMAWQGPIEVESIDQFAATDESIWFQATFSSQTGRWVVGDAWHMRDGRITVHYSFAHRAGEPASRGGARS